MIAAPEVAVFRFGAPEIFEFGATSSVMDNTVATKHHSRQSAKLRYRQSRSQARLRDEAVTSKFESFRAAFLQHFNMDIHTALQDALGKSVQVSPAPLGLDVQRLFVETIENTSPSSLKVCPTLHGTPARNFNAIFQRGLLVPGQGNEVTIANGAAHGTGVYTANLNASWLSAGFCSEAKMLVCAVLQTSEVKHVQDAQVVTNAAHVIPLFVAVGSVLHRTRSEAPQRSLPSAVAVSGLLQVKQAAELREAGRTVADLKEAGYVAAALRLAGYSTAELRCHFTAGDLRDAGYKATEMLQAGLTLADLKHACYPAADLPVAVLLELGYSLVSLRQAGCSAASLKSLGFGVAELQEAGYTPLDLRWGGCSGGYTAAELKKAGFTASDLKWVCTIWELQQAGYAAAELAALGGLFRTAVDAQQVPVPDDDDEEL